MLLQNAAPPTSFPSSILVHAAVQQRHRHSIAINFASPSILHRSHCDIHHLLVSRKHTLSQCSNNPSTVIFPTRLTRQPQHIHPFFEQAHPSSPPCSTDWQTFNFTPVVCPILRPSPPSSTDWQIFSVILSFFWFDSRENTWRKIPASPDLCPFALQLSRHLIGSHTGKIYIFLSAVR